MDKYIDRLEKILAAESGGKYTVFARKVGISPSTFQYYMKGKLPSTKHLIRIYEHCGININWLLTGEGEMLSDKQKDKSEPLQKKEKTCESGARHIDEKELERIVEIMEDWLEENKIKTSGKQKVRLITRLANR